MIYPRCAIWSCWLRAIVLALLAIESSPTAATAVTPKALSVPVRADWYGYDGQWSPVSIRVGTPPQWVDVFVSTASQETWVVGPWGCSGESKCQRLRGGIFTQNRSSTWREYGFAELGLDLDLGFKGVGDYGFDNIALDNTISLPSQLIGVVNTTDYWLGFLGLGVKPTNISGVEQLTFLSSTVENQSLVPSHSFGYTAGAYYRLKHVPASLTLGGVDANRFDPHNVSFDLDPDQKPVVAVSQIAVSAKPLASSQIRPGWSGDSLTLLGGTDTALFTIDSSTPYLWLPEPVCAQFEKNLGLTYDEGLQLYTFGKNQSQHGTLVNWNLTFTFIVADLPGSSNSVSLSLPYAAFDLQLTYPFPGLQATEFSPSTNYFPLRKAANSTQYTIGRAFLQETYLKVDYERNKFSLYQASFAPDAISNLKLIDISRPDGSSFTGPRLPPANATFHNASAGQPGGLKKGTIIGIAVGAGAGASLLIAAAIFYFCTRRSKLSTTDVGAEKPSVGKSKTLFVKIFEWFVGPPKSEPPPEIDGAMRFPNEAPAENEIKEMPAETPLELPGSAVDASFAEAARGKFGAAPISPGNHDPKKPVELEDRANWRDYYAPEDTAQPSPVSLPAYSPSRVGRRNTQTTGISSRTPHDSRESSQVSSPIVISPLTPNYANPFVPSMAHIARRELWIRDGTSTPSNYSDRGASTADEFPTTPHSYREEAGFPSYSEHGSLHPSPYPSRHASQRRSSWEDKG